MRRAPGRQYRRGETDDYRSAIPDFCYPVIPAKARIQRAANQASHANQARTASGQNQDLRDSIRSSLIGKHSSISILAGFPAIAKSAIRSKRNPENPVNPDSDKDPLSPPASSIHIGGLSGCGEKRNPGKDALVRAGISRSRAEPTAFAVWIPAFAGMTG